MLSRQIKDVTGPKMLSRDSSRHNLSRWSLWPEVPDTR